jgi:hypothetical protein
VSSRRMGLTPGCRARPSGRSMGLPQKDATSEAMAHLIRTSAAKPRREPASGSSSDSGSMLVS